jgi:TolB-like protein/DNA-binding winged helix-turn-helix (wHTH) protein/cytochrome c-type biogenesis protein CcmH/NrfG
MSPEQARASHPDEPFTVGEWRVDQRANELTRDGETVKLEPKAMQVLCFLASRQGSVVSREELEIEAWSRMVVTQDAVTNAIIKVRKALGDEARHPRYIETVSKSGYRLIAEVGRGAPETPVPLSATWWKRRRLLLALLLLLTTVAAGLWLVPTQETAPFIGPVEDPLLLERKLGIAVLPFDNVGADPGQAYFADGLTEDLITDLSKLSGLRVVARSSTLAYKDSVKTEEVIARELGVDYLLEGSVRRSGDSVRINVRLSDSGGGGNLWAERFDRRMDDIFQIQDEIAAQIVAALNLEIGPDERSRMTRNNLASVQAYDEFLRGLDYYGRRSQEDTRLAVRHYERAIAIDPGFARAYAGLALVYTRDAVDGWDLTARDSLIQAAELTEKARRLDPSVPQIYFVEGQIELFRRKYDAAIRNAEQAISIKPSYADGYALLAWILHFAGRPSEGLASMQQAVRLNPRVPSVYRLVRGALYYSAGEIDKSLQDLEAAVEISPNYQLLRTWLAAANAAADRIDEARWEGQEILALDPEFSTSRVEQTFPIRDPAYRERLVNDLKRAGLPD